MKSIILILFAGCSIMSLQAQTTAGKDSLLNREMTLEKEYNPTVREASKLNQFPELREPQAPKTKVEFSNYATPYDIQSGITPLNPQAYLTRLNTSKYRGYLTGGISSLVDINGDFGYQFLNSDKDFLNIFASHRSSNCLVDNIQIDAKQKFKINDTWGGFQFKHDFNGVQLTADAKYTYSEFNYSGLFLSNYSQIMSSSAMGIEPVYSILDSFPKQANNLFEAHIGIASDKANELNYRLDFAYTQFQQKYASAYPGTSTNPNGIIDIAGSKENRILIDGDVHKMINSTVGLGIAGFVKTYSYPVERFRIWNDTTTNYWVYSLNPYFYLEDDNFNLSLGAKMNVEVGGQKRIVVAPTLQLRYHPNDQLLFYALADGGIKDNSQYAVFYENRYVNPLLRMMDAWSPLDATAGIKFLPLSNLSVAIFAGYKIVKDEHFYLPSPKNTVYEPIVNLVGTKISAEYQDANRTKLGANIQYAFQDNIEIGLQGVYSHWNITSEYYADGSPIPSSSKVAWNKPNVELNLNGAYRFADLPLRLEGSYYGAFGRKTQFFASPVVKMNDVHDLSAKATYAITPFFSAYASISNLLFAKYDIWPGYPAQTFNTMVGFSFLF